MTALLLKLNTTVTGLSTKSDDLAKATAANASGWSTAEGFLDAWWLLFGAYIVFFMQVSAHNWNVQSATGTRKPQIPERIMAV